MVRFGLRLCTALGAGLIAFGLPDRAYGQNTLDVMVFDMDADTVSQIGTLFATMEDRLLAEDCPVDFELGTVTVIENPELHTMGAETSFRAIRDLEADAVVLLGIGWCPEQLRLIQGELPAGPLRGVVGPHYGCSYGDGFAVAVSGYDDPIVWLHERGHVLGLEHVAETGFVMSEHRLQAGSRVTAAHCTAFQRGRPSRRLGR